ncbi:MAG: 2-dehydropantoate 2-reductase [Dehalococcoidales bacterium]|jgi:2-dehydropantoate 2-reductase|nr:2-dehydropantoate 2-reductase [Dehalococcoidales bacterium]MDP7524945.1 2-dehydropantoate 2-reductase [Dehalococcoidales bacterium]
MKRNISSHLQSIAVIGAGAVGSYYGARLAQAGHDVRFLLRRDYQAVKANGLKVTSPDGNIALDNLRIALNSREIGPVDWVLCALKATSIDEALELVRPCVASETGIIVLMNGLGLEERFARWFGPERIFGGLAFTCINRGKPGHVEHLAYGSITLGHYQNAPAELETAAALWAESKVTVTTSPSLMRARWEKLCWNIPFNGLAIRAGAITTDRILADPGLREAARRLMEEVIAVGNADLASGSEPARIDGDAVISRMFELTATMGAYKPSTMTDFVEGKPMEIEAIFGEPLKRAQLLGVDTPQLVLLTSQLRTLNRWMNK